MTVYSSYDANNVLKLRFDDYQSFDISNIQYDGYYLKISNSTTGSYYNLDLPHLQQTNLEFADGVKTRLYYVDHINDKIVEYKNEGLDTRRIQT